MFSVSVICIGKRCEVTDINLHAAFPGRMIKPSSLHAHATIRANCSQISKTAYRCRPMMPHLLPDVLVVGPQRGVEFERCLSELVCMFQVMIQLQEERDS